MKDLVTKVGFLLALACLLALLVNSFSPRGIPLVGQWDTEEGVVTADSEAVALWLDFEIPDPQSAKKVFDQGQALFIDVRSRDMFNEGHIPGALSWPLLDIEANTASAPPGIALNRPIVTYCSGRLCQDSHTAAQLLIERGFENVVVFIDGMPGWIANGYPVEKP